MERKNNISLIFILILILVLFACRNNFAKQETNPKLKELLSQSDELYNNNNYKQAIELFNQIIQIDSTKGIAYYRRGICYSFIYDYQKSIRDHLKCISLNYRVEDSYLDLGLSYETLEDFTNALYYYRRTLDINPKNTKAQDRINSINQLGKEIYKLKEGGDSLVLEKTKKSMKFNAVASKIIVNSSKPLTSQETVDLRNAIVLLDSAIAIDPFVSSNYINKSHAQQILGLYPEAIKTLDIIIKIAPYLGELYSEKGFIYEKMGKLDSANISYKNAIDQLNKRISNSNENTKKSEEIKLNALMEKAFLESLLNFKKGLSQINSLIKKYPDNQDLKLFKKVWFDDFNRKEFIDNF